MHVTVVKCAALWSRWRKVWLSLDSRTLIRSRQMKDAFRDDVFFLTLMFTWCNVVGAACEEGVAPCSILPAGGALTEGCTETTSCSVEFTEERPPHAQDNKWLPGQVG